MEKVIIEKPVLAYFDELIYRLFENGYFSYVESSLEYVSNILEFIQKYLPQKPHKKTPEELQHYGSYYTYFKANNTTTWYFFFETRNGKYIIRKILNNHLPEIGLLNLL